MLKAGLAYIPLLAAAKVFLPGSQGSFSRCVCFVERYVFRELTIGHVDTAQLEQKLGEAGRGLTSGWSADELLEYLRSQVDDVEFEGKFASHVERRATIQYYILSELERCQLGRGRGVVPGDHHTARNHIEHILPKRLSKDRGRSGEWGWARHDQDSHRRLVNRLGNLIILEGDINKAVSNHAFAAKQSGRFTRSNSGRISQFSCYRDSALPSATNLSDSSTWPEWTETQIDRRQRDMASLALTVWEM